MTRRSNKVQCLILCSCFSSVVWIHNTHTLSSKRTKVQWFYSYTTWPIILVMSWLCWKWRANETSSTVEPSSRQTWQRTFIMAGELTDLKMHLNGDILHYVTLRDVYADSDLQRQSISKSNIFIIRWWTEAVTQSSEVMWSATNQPYDDCQKCYCYYKCERTFS